MAEARSLFSRLRTLFAVKRSAMRVHSYFPGQDGRVLFAMAGDDVSLHFDLGNLTPKQQEDHQSNIILTGMLEVALLCIGKPGDQVALYDEFQAEPWRDMLDFYHQAFQQMGASVVRLEDCHFHPSQSYYASVAAADPHVDLITLYMVSGSNSVLHKSQDAWNMSRNVNSKVHFAAHAPEAGIPVPETFVCTKKDLGSTRVADFFARYDNKIILKTLGLAGARNVTPVSSVQAAMDYVAEYGDEMPVILQEKLDTERYTEMTVDLIVSHDDVRVANVRRILFGDGLWVGNLIGESVKLRPEDEAMLIRVGEYARTHGYSAPEGLNLGIDYFVSNDDIIITEINARWTGGLFPAQVIKEIGLEGQDCVAFIDQVPVNRLKDYQDFTRAHLKGASTASFQSVPFGFGPFPVPGEDGDFIFVWQIVEGDFEAFKRAKNENLGPDVLPTADRISLVI